MEVEEEKEREERKGEMMEGYLYLLGLPLGCAGGSESLLLGPCMRTGWSVCTPRHGSRRRVFS